jgi:hypothetical protein
MGLGYRIEAISILGREVMLPRGLVGLGLDSIDLCGPEIADVRVPYYLLCHFNNRPSVFGHLPARKIMEYWYTVRRGRIAPV